MSNNDNRGRPPEEGLPWFPHQTRLDSKFGLLEAEVRDRHGWKEACSAWAIVFKMFQQIYGEKGYYYPWDYEHKLLWVDKEKIDRTFAEYAIDLAVKRGIFHEGKLEQYGVLTSKGLQERYISGTYRRSHVVLYKELILTEDVERDNIIIKSISDNDNQAAIKILSSEKEQQQKEVKASVKGGPAHKKLKEITRELVDLWNSKHETNLRAVSSKRIKYVKRALKTFTRKQVEGAIIHHAAEPWVYENNQQSNFDHVLGEDETIDHWLNRPPKNGHVKKFNPEKDPAWIPFEIGEAHAKHHRKQLKPAFYEMTEHEGKKYVKPKFTDNTEIPEELLNPQP